MDQRMLDILTLLEDAPLDKINTVLDIGVGDGEISLWFANKGKKVTATGIEIDSYNINKKKFTENNISIIDCYVEKMPFPDKSFDAVVLSHVLEHCLDVGIVLQEIKRVLKNDGYLLIFVPPYSNYVISGHATTGWNVGQLIYVLLLNGFNVKTGKFIQYGYNVAAIVQNGNFLLPQLRRDGGDIRTLYEAGLLPQQINFNDENHDGFKGDILNINWDRKIRINKKQKIVKLVIKVLPYKILKKIIPFFKRMLDFLNLHIK